MLYICTVVARCHYRINYGGRNIMITFIFLTVGAVLLLASLVCFLLVEIL